MNADRLLKLYQKVAEAPDAIQRLRRFVLDLAVRGTLVEQDPTDEPAAKLLDQIDRERRARLEGGGIKSGNPLEPIDNRPFETPPGWEWIPLGATGNIFSGNSINAVTREKLEKTSEGRPFIATKDVGYGLDEIIYANGLLVPSVDDSFKVARPKSVLICAEGGSAGRKIGLSNREICFGNKLLANETWSVVVPEFVRFVYMSDFFYSHFASRMTGVIGGISIKKFQLLPFPLPPLVEQRRIVAKVQELMELLDQLEAVGVVRETIRDRLTIASLARLSEPDTDREAFSDHARFALDALPALTARPDQIKSLRQTILNLGVRGKLVEQNPADEPAAELLKRIESQLVNQRNERGTKVKSLPDIDQADAPFELPNGWTWARFPELGTFGRGKSKHRPRNDPTLYTGGTYPMIQTGDVARSGGRITTFTNKYNDDGLAQSMLWPKGTLCITIAANIADSGILGFDACFPDSVVGFTPVPVFENARYFEYFVRTAKTNLLEFAPSTAQKNINLKILTSVLIPLPPLAEQKRIVARMDELMAWLDRLEAILSAVGTTRSCLLESTLQKALEATFNEREAA